jgi:26S proteasome regulatory subunit N5
MRSMLGSLNKKRAQSREAVSCIVKHSLNDILTKLNEEEQIKLLKALVEITEGRIFVELEYSIIVRKLTDIFLMRNDIEEAAKLIQDIQIETFGSLDRIYKVDYILFQMRILISKGDYVRTLIVSNKINRKHLNDDGLEKLKVEFFQLVIRYYLNEERFIDVSKSYKILYDFYKEIELKMTNRHLIKPDILQNYTDILNNQNKQLLFVNYVMYLAICPPELETKNMFNELNMFYKKDLEENQEMHNLVKGRLSDDLVHVDTNFLGNYIKYPIFAKDEIQNPNAEKQFSLFRKFWIQHDVLIYGKYFSQIKLDRISAMIGVDKNEVEAEVSDMVINNRVYAKINRTFATVNFRKKQEPTDKLSDLNFDLSTMLEKIENTCHLIHKDNLKYDIK